MYLQENCLCVLALSFNRCVVSHDVSHFQLSGYFHRVWYTKKFHLINLNRQNNNNNYNSIGCCCGGCCCCCFCFCFQPIKLTIFSLYSFVSNENENEREIEKTAIHIWFTRVYPATDRANRRVNTYFIINKSIFRNHIGLVSKQP